MSDIWHLVKKSLHCKPDLSEVYDPNASQRKKQGKIDTSNGNENGEGVEEPHPRGRIIHSLKTYFVYCNAWYIFSKSKLLVQKDFNDPPTSTRYHECGEKPKSIDTIIEDHDISEHSVIQLKGSSRKIIEHICQDDQIDSKSKATQIECVLKFQNKEETFASFGECKEMVSINAEKLQSEHPRCLVDGNEMLRFYGATVACSLGVNGSSTLCTLDQCGLCQILRHGFSANHEFHDTLGVLTTSTSINAIDSIAPSNESNSRKSVIVCRVIAGKIYNPLQEIQEMTNSMFDSVVKKINDQLEIEELNVLNPRGVLPCFVTPYGSPPQSRSFFDFPLSRRYSMRLRVLKSKTKTHRRHRPRLRYWPITFSPFARALALARVPSISMAKLKTTTHAPNPLRYPLPRPVPSPQLSESSDEEFDGVVQADFSFFDPKPDDFHGVKTLLQAYLDDQEWDLSSFVDLILGQTTVGTVVKIEDDEDEGVFALVTALNLWRYREHKCFGTLKDFLLLKARQEEGVADQLRLLLGEQARDVGLLVSQRVVNLPPQLLPHLYDALFDEVSWATEDEPTEDLRNSFKFKHYIILSKIYMHKNVEQKRKLSYNSDAAIIYIKPENEIFHKLSVWSFCFPLQTEQLTPHELRDYRSTGLVMAVEADKIPTFRQDLASLINET
ncbi:hypothetical protein VNO77_01449 [Canavalia gladiata]|uniref:Protein BCCIP homolog n=1 Tax=Canavalia gladiata TaxID=3824 RepID=A0AAN9MRF3_CANGL